MNLLLRLLALATVLLGSGCASLSHAQRDRAEDAESRLREADSSRIQAEIRARDAEEARRAAEATAGLTEGQLAERVEKARAEAARAAEAKVKAAREELRRRAEEKLRAAAETLREQAEKRVRAVAAVPPLG